MMSLAEFHFIRPYWLLALIPAIIMTVVLLKNKLNQGNWADVCDAQLLPFVLQNKATQHSRLSLSVGAIACFLAIFALAGPTWERLPVPVFRNDAALVIALDLSRSMDASDIKPSRLRRARYKIADILKKRKDGQTALLVYAGDAFTVTPLTEDTETIASQVSALTTEIMPSQGSNTVLALEKAVELLKQTGLQTGEILLVTDGVDFDSTEAIVEELGAYKLSILGVGTEDGAPVKISRGGFLKDAQGNIVVPKLNDSELSRLAEKGNGIYRSISSDDSDINALLEQLDSPAEKEANENNNLLIDQWSEKGPWLLLLVLPLAALSFRKGLLSIALICLLPFPETSYAFEWKDLWQTQNQQAQNAFKQENYQQAAEQFDNPQWKAAAQYKAGQLEQAIETLQHDDSATGLYNKGNALAQSGQLQEALTAYEKSLEINPDNEDAKYNKEQVEKELEKQKQKQQQSDENQQSEQDGSQQDDEEKDEQGDSSEQSGEQDKKEQDSNAEQSEQQQSEESSESDEKEEPDKAEGQQEQKAEETESEDKSEDVAESSEYDESEQANEQWLKRIPDDPAGLLKRKFKYQYGQRGRKTKNDQAW
jgi:Ca-activated chloride channel family protein